MRETRLSSSMSGVWKQSKAMLLRHQQTNGLATARRRLHHCATRRLYPVNRRGDLRCGWGGAEELGSGAILKGRGAG